MNFEPCLGLLRAPNSMRTEPMIEPTRPTTDRQAPTIRQCRSSNGTQHSALQPGLHRRMYETYLFQRPRFSCTFSIQLLFVQHFCMGHT